jgi:hypothetical protein
LAVEQNLQNHRRLHVPYAVAATVFLINVIFTLEQTVETWRRPHPHHGLHVWLVVVSVALLMTVLMTRSNPLKVQDRLIRLEEQLRFARLLATEDQVLAARLTLRQIIALRFASDTELPSLVRRAVAESLDSKAIKRAITKWRTDDLRV